MSETLIAFLIGFLCGLVFAVALAVAALDHMDDPLVRLPGGNDDAQH